MTTENFKRAKKIEEALKQENEKLKRLVESKEKVSNISIKISEVGRSDFYLPLSKTQKEIILSNMILEQKHKIMVLEREFERL